MSASVRNWRRVLALAIIGLLLLGSARTLWQALRAPDDPGAASVRHAAEGALRLRPWLPARGYVGYLSDAPGARGYVGQYHAMQYALAPLMLVMIGEVPPGTPRESAAEPPLAGGLVIGDFRDPARLQAAMRALGLEEVARADATLVLLRRRGAP